MRLVRLLFAVTFGLTFALGVLVLSTAADAQCYCKINCKTGCVPPPPPPPRGSEPLATPIAASDAAELYARKCKGCHGATGRADTKMGKKERIPDVTTPEWKKRWTDLQIRDVITKGPQYLSYETKQYLSLETKMKAYKESLTPEQIAGLVVYIRNLK